MKKITLLIILLIASLGFSQEVIQNFEAAGAVNGDPFGGMAVPSVITGSGSNATQVLEIVGNINGEVWQGINLNLTKNVELTSTKTMSIDVYSATPITFLVKVNGGLAGAPEAAAEVTHNGNSTWQTLDFTFDTALDGKAATANGVYASFVLHAYWAAGATGFGTVTKDSRTFYVDNIFGIAVVDLCTNGVQDGDETGIDCGGTCSPCPPSTAAPTPLARAEGDVISLFSNAYTNIGVTEWSTAWDLADVTDLQITGNDTKKITYGTFLGIQLASSIDLTNFTHMHFDYWITDALADGQVLNPKLSNHANDAGETSAIIYTNPITTTGEWVSFDVPLANFSIGGGGSAARNKINQILLDCSATLDEVYIDNLYFHKNTTLSADSFNKTAFSLFPNPTQDSWTVKTQNIKMSSIQIFDILGKQVLSLKPEATEATIDASQLRTGLYFAKIGTANGSTSLKLVKE